MAGGVVAEKVAKAADVVENLSCGRAAASKVRHQELIAVFMERSKADSLSIKWISVILFVQCTVN